MVTNNYVRFLLRTLGLIIGLNSIAFWIKAVYEDFKFFILFVVCITVGVVLMVFI